MRARCQIAYRAGSDIAAKASLLAVTVVAARQLPQHDFGLFGVATTTGWLLGVLTDAGIQLHVARSVAQAPERRGVILRSWLRVRLGLAAAAFATTAAALLGFRPPAIVPLLLLVACYLLSATTELLFYFFRGIGRSDLESTIVVCQRSVMSIAAFGVLAWRPSLTLLAAVMLATSLVAFAVTYVVALRIGPVHDGTGPASIASGAVFTRDVLPIGAGIMLSAIYFRVDVLLVELWRGADAVAVYNAVFRIVEAARLFPAAALAVALPALCRAEDGRPLARIAAGVTTFGAATSLILWAAARWIVPLLYGARYADGVGAFRTLLAAVPLMSLNYALTHQLIGWNGQRAYIAVCTAALAVNLLLNAVLIPAWSIDGAAWATVVTEVVVTAGCAAALMARRQARRLVVATT